VAAGRPGSIVGAFVPMTPCRLIDTRPDSTVGVNPGTIDADDTFVFQVRGASDPCPTMIPPNALALATNVTAVTPTANTFLTIWDDGPRPLSANLNPRPGGGPTPNAVDIPLGNNGDFRIYNLAGSVHVVVDVMGYFVDHDHAQLYYSKVESDGRFAPAADTWSKSDVYTRAEVEAAIKAAVPTMTSTIGNDCNVDTTGPGELNEGVYETCATVSTGTVGSHRVLLTMNAEWFTNAVESTGFCRIERDGVPIPSAEMQMGESTDTTFPSTHHHSGLTIDAGPFTGSGSYTVDCREFIRDIDYRNIGLAVTVFPVLP